MSWIIIRSIIRTNIAFINTYVAFGDVVMVGLLDWVKLYFWHVIASLGNLFYKWIHFLDLLDRGLFFEFVVLHWFHRCWFNIKSILSYDLLLYSLFDEDLLFFSLILLNCRARIGIIKGILRWNCKTRWGLWLLFTLRYFGFLIWCLNRRFRFDSVRLFNLKLCLGLKYDLVGWDCLLDGGLIYLGFDVCFHLGLFFLLSWNDLFKQPLLSFTNFPFFISFFRLIFLLRRTGLF